MSSGKTKYIIDDIHDIIVKQIVYTDVAHRVSYNIAMQLVENSLRHSHCYASLISFFLLLIIFLNLHLLVMDYISGERLIHILKPWSNNELSEICSLNRGVLIERLLRVSYAW